MEGISDQVKKNILDLQYNKYLQYYNTAIIVLFTYFIGVGIAILTKQINFNDPRQSLSLGLISTAFVTVCVLSLLYFKNAQENILQGIKELKI